MEIRRFDLLDDIGKFEKTSEGFLRFFDVKLTRSGVFDYRKSDGSISKEFRCDSEVFSHESLASLKNGLPIVNSISGPYVCSKSYRLQPTRIPITFYKVWAIAISFQPRGQ